jgi:predicted AAA+ superfamily ATPase
MENLVFTELVKKGNEPNRELFYYKTRNDREIDFVVKNGHEVAELIQVAYDVSNPDVEEREVKALVEAGAELKVDKLTILTWNEKKEVKKGDATIVFRPLHEWMLEIKEN